MRIERVRIMLHTLNKAWTEILIHHAGKKILFIYTNQKECDMVTDTISEVYREANKDDSKLCNMWVISEEEIKSHIELCKSGSVNFEICDDILISDKIHDCMLLDFLGRHCKRKCC